MRRISVLLTICLLAFAVARANDFTVGSTVENFTLPDINNVEKSFNDLKGEKGTIVVFLSAQCPVVKAYNERLNAVAADYKTKGVNFIGINSNATETLDRIKTHATENYKFPILIDKGNVIADKFNANITPEMYLFDKDGKLVYHGSIDNDKSGMNIKSVYLRDALDQYLDGKEIKVTTTKAFGCTIKRKEN